MFRFRVILDDEALKAVRQRDTATLPLFGLDAPTLPKGARPQATAPTAQAPQQPSLFSPTPTAQARPVAPAQPVTPAPKAPAPSEAERRRQEHNRRAVEHTEAAAGAEGEAREAHVKAARAHTFAGLQWAAVAGPGGHEFQAADAQRHSDRADAASTRAKTAAAPPPKAGDDFFADWKDADPPPAAEPAAAPQAAPEPTRTVHRTAADPSEGGRLIPVKKRDRNGVLTTRWVLPETDQENRDRVTFRDTGDNAGKSNGTPPEETEEQRAAREAKEAKEAEAREQQRQRNEQAKRWAAEEAKRREAEVQRIKDVRDGWEYPFDAPPEALLPSQLQPGRVPHYSTWTRAQGTDQWRVADTQVATADLMEARDGREGWQRLIENAAAEGRDLVIVPHGAIPTSGAQRIAGTADPATYEDLPPDFLGLKIEAFSARAVQGPYGTDYEPNVHADPFLLSCGFWEAFGPLNHEGAWARRFFLSQVGRGKTWGQLSEKVQAIYAGIFRNLASWWTDLNDDEREEFNRRYVNAERQPQRAGLDKDARHEDEAFALPPGMEKFKAAGYALHAYQKKAANFTIKHAPRAVLAMEMGLGKTLTAISVFMDRRAAGEVDRMLVTAPLSAHGAWQEHFEDFTDGLRVKYLTGATIAQRRKAYDAFEKGDLDVLVMSPDTLALKTKTGGADELEALPAGHKVTGYDHYRGEMIPRGSYIKHPNGMWMRDDPHARGMLTEKDAKFTGKDVAQSHAEIRFDDPEGDVARVTRIMAKHGPKVLRVADEVQKFKNPEAARSRGFWQAVTDHDGRVIGMTGTPKPNGAADFYHVVDHIAPGALGPDLDDFARRYCYKDQRNEVTGFRPEELTRLHADNAHVMFARTTADPDSKINLPSRIDVAPQIPMDETQKELQKHLMLYMEVRAAADRERRAMERDEFIGDTNIRRMEDAKEGKYGPLERAAAKAAPYDGTGVLLRWSQLAIDPTALDPQFAEDFPAYESPKLQAVAEATIQHLTQQPETGAVLFCEYHSGMHAMHRALIKRGVAEDKIGIYHGGTSAKERKRLRDALNNGDIKVLIGQTASLETGANLQKRANFVAHLNTPWAPDRLTQSTARVHRQGQTRKVTVFRPVGSEVEALIERTVSRKIQESRQATGKEMEADAAAARSMQKGQRAALDAASIAATLGIPAELLAKDQGQKLKMPDEKAQDAMSREAWIDSIVRNDILPRHREEYGDDAADALQVEMKALRKKHPTEDPYTLLRRAKQGGLDL